MQPYMAKDYWAKTRPSKFVHRRIDFNPIVSNQTLEKGDQIGWEIETNIAEEGEAGCSSALLHREGMNHEGIAVILLLILLST